MSQLDAKSGYEHARVRAEKKRKFRSDLAVYIVINAFLVVVWAVTGLGYFWPGWVIGGWGVFLILSAWELFFRREVTDEDIRREMRKGH